MENELVPLPAREYPIELIPSSREVMDAFLDKRDPNTKRAYTFDLADFALFLKKNDRVASMETFFSVTRGEANRVAEKYAVHLKNRGLASATIARRLSTLRSLVETALELECVHWRLSVEVPKVESYRDTRGPGDENWKRIRTKGLEEATKTKKGKRDLALLQLLHSHALRRGECVSLDMEHVDFERETISVKRKGKSERINITMVEATREALRKWVGVRGSKEGPLFTRLDPGADGPELERLTGDSVCRMVKRLSKLAGLREAARPHGLRHHAITRALEKTNGNVQMTMQFSGHAKPETVQKYNDKRHDYPRQVAELVDDDD